MREETGDIFAYPGADAIVIPTNLEVDRNGMPIMGAGVALEAKQRWPDLPMCLSWQYHDNGPGLYVYGDGLGQMPYAVICFPTKRRWRWASDLSLIEQSAREMVAHVELRNKVSRNTWSVIVMPRAGAGLGKRDWETEVRPILERHLDSRFVVLTPLTALLRAPGGAREGM